MHGLITPSLKVLVVSCVYPPEPVVSARVSSDLANYLAGRGHSVTVVCPFPTRPPGVSYPLKNKGETRITVGSDGVEVVRLPSFAHPASGLAGRAFESWSFGAYCSRYVKSHCRDYDVIYANTWPLCAQAAIAKTARSLGIPLVLHIQDIYPETLWSKLPRWMSAVVIPPLRYWDRRIARKARQVVLIAERKKEYYQRTRRLSAGGVTVVSNWQDESLFEPSVEADPSASHNREAPVGIQFLYLGSLSPTADLETAIRAFRKASIPNSRFIIAGDGSTKNACVALAKSIGNETIHFTPCVSENEVPVLQASADVCLLPLKRSVALSGVPSKLPAYLFSAKPVLATVDAESDTAQVIREARCGWVGEPEDLDWLAAKMRAVSALSPVELVRMGRRGRVYGLACFSRSKGLPALAEKVLAVAGSKTGA